jgi:hypothetical protein
MGQRFTHRRVTRNGLGEISSTVRKPVFLQFYVHGCSAFHRYSGFELEDVDANQIVISAGVADKSTPLNNIRYMRNLMQNAELFEFCYTSVISLLTCWTIT